MFIESFKQLSRLCEQCGTCTASCPMSDVTDFNIRRLVRHLQIDLHEDGEFLRRFPWLCTQCGRCRVLCTEGLDVPGLVMALRRLALEKNATPVGVGRTLQTIRAHDSAFVSPTRTKKSWAKPSLKLTPHADLLYWVGCTTAIMTPRIPEAAGAVMNRLGVEFKLLDDEPCCGEPLLSLGLMDEARAVATRVIHAIKTANVRKVATSCAGCFNTFSRLYPEMLGIEPPGVEVVHISRLLEENTGNGPPLRLEKPLKLAYHDPCSLGRHCGIYDAPRQVLKSIEGVTLIEMTPSRELATCCGAGGGLWSVNQEAAMEIAYRKIRDMVSVLGVEALVTCCPLCYLNFRRGLARARVAVGVFEIAELSHFCKSDVK